MSVMHQEMAAVLVKHGTPVLKDESFYGWVDYDAKFHHEGMNMNSREIDATLACGWVVPDKPKIEQLYVQEFTDTYNDALEGTKVQLHGVSCACGEYENVTLRFKGDGGEFFSLLLEEGDNNED